MVNITFIQRPIFTIENDKFVIYGHKDFVNYEGPDNATELLIESKLMKRPKQQYYFKGGIHPQDIEKALLAPKGTEYILDEILKRLKMPTGQEWLALEIEDASNLPKELEVFMARPRRRDYVMARTGEAHLIAKEISKKTGYPYVIPTASEIINLIYKYGDLRDISDLGPYALHGSEVILSEEFDKLNPDPARYNSTAKEHQVTNGAASLRAFWNSVEGEYEHPPTNKQALDIHFNQLFDRGSIVVLKNEHPA